MTPFYKRISLLCDEYGTNISSVVKKCGIASGAPTKWKREDSIPSRTSLQKMASFFNVSVDYLLGADEEEGKPGKWIPVFERVAAGVPIEAIGDVVDQEQLSPNMDMSYEYCGLIIRGNSMYPRILNGDTVIVRLQDTVESGDTAIVFINGTEATCKVVKKTENGIELHSENPEYGVMPFTDEQIKTLPIKFFGKVVELRRKFK